jgi:hypothetical protein
MDVITFVMTTGLVATGALNFLLASTTPGNVINWLAGIISVSYGALLIAMWKHMINEEKHINKRVDTSKFITIDQCDRTHTGVIQKLEEIKEELKEHDKQVFQNAINELEKNKLYMQILLLKSGVDPKQISSIENGSSKNK